MPSGQTKHFSNTLNRLSCHSSKYKPLYQSNSGLFKCYSLILLTNDMSTASKTSAKTEITPDKYLTSSIKFLFHHIFGVYVASPSSTLSFRIFLSSIHLRERKNDSRFVAETSSAWVHSLIHLSKIENKNFFEKKPLYWRAANKRDTFRENKKLQKPEDFEEVIEDRRSVPKKGILNEKMDLNILISQLNHDVQNEMKVSL